MTANLYEDPGHGVNPDDGLRVLVVTNLYPTPESPAYGTFVGEQVEDLRSSEDTRVVDVLFVDPRPTRFSYVSGCLAFWRLLRRRTYDVVHAHFGFTGLLAITQRRVPVVVTFH